MKAISDLIGGFLVTLVTAAIGLTITGSWAVLGAILVAPYLGTFVWLAIVYCCVEFDPPKFKTVVGHLSVKGVGLMFQIWFTWLLAPSEHAWTAVTIVIGLWLVGMSLQAMANHLIARRDRAAA